MARGVASLLVALAACAEPPRLPDRCADELAPIAPTVVTAIAGRRDVTAASFAIDVTAPADPDGDYLAATDYEVWTANADGGLRERVWSAQVVSTHPPPVTLAMGAYEGSAAALGQLPPWRDHLIRVRHRTRAASGCAQVGAWSPTTPSLG